MAYTTIAIVREESPFKDTTNIVDAYVTRAITQADSYIDSKVGQVYDLPLASTPAIIQELSTKLAIYNLLTDQNLNIEIAQGVNVTQLLQDVNDILDSIVKRDTRLVDTSGDELALNDNVLMDGYPDQASTDDGTAPRFFTMNQTF